MSKVLKFIVHVVILAAIVCALGLVLPPFFGVRTVVIDSSDEKTNLPVGSVTYAIPEKVEDVYKGEAILVEEDDSTYRYNVESINTENRTGTVIDPSVTNGSYKTVAISDYVPKVVITIGYIGYLQIATKSIEGLIIIGLAILFLIILFIIAELWKKDDDDVDLDRDPEPGYVKSRKELKREEKAREKRYKQEEFELINEDRQSKPAKKTKKKSSAKPKPQKKVIRTGGFVDEIDEADEEEEREPVTIEPEITEAHNTLKKEIMAATSENDEEEVKTVKRRPAKKTSNSSAAKTVKTKKKKRANPGYSAEQIARKAKDQGDTPERIKDEITDVTLFDYSDIFDDEEE